MVLSKHTLELGMDRRKYKRGCRLAGCPFEDTCCGLIGTPSLMECPLCHETWVTFEGESITCTGEEIPHCFDGHEKTSGTCATCLDEFEDWS